MENVLQRIISKCCHLFHINVAKCFPSQGKVLMLHWVGDKVLDDECEPFRISVAQCKRLLLWLKSKNTIRLENWEQSEDFYALTIDDVPENFYHNAFPLLKEYGIPFTLFVNVSLLDKEGFITKKQLLEMSQCDLCTVGSHGVNHGEYALLKKGDALRDLKESKRVLEQLIGKPVEMYAFPYGSYYACGYANKYLAGDVYKYAFSTIACPITKPLLLKRFFLPRINVNVEFINSL